MSRSGRSGQKIIVPTAPLAAGTMPDISERHAGMQL